VDFSVYPLFISGSACPFESGGHGPFRDMRHGVLLPASPALSVPLSGIVNGFFRFVFGLWISAPDIRRRYGTAGVRLPFFADIPGAVPVRSLPLIHGVGVGGRVKIFGTAFAVVDIGHGWPF
jgi:hypothetical protein